MRYLQLWTLWIKPGVQDPPDLMGQTVSTLYLRRWVGLRSTVHWPCCSPPPLPLPPPPPAPDPMERWSEPVELTPEEDCIESELRHLALEVAEVELFSWRSLLGMCWGGSVQYLSFSDLELDLNTGEVAYSDTGYSDTV